MNPQEILVPFLLAAKAVIYDAKRAAQLLGMLATKTGAVNAVHTVTSVIEQKKPIPDNIKPILGVSILMLLLDVVKQVTGQTASKEMMAEVVKILLSEQPVENTPNAGIINQGA